MKRFFWLFLVAFIVACCSDDSIGEVEKIYTLIPDEKFEQILIDQGFDSDQMINRQMSYTDAKSITELSIIVQNGYDLRGIEDFINLKSLYIQGGETTNLGLNANSSLTDLTLHGTHIENSLVFPLESILKNLVIYNTSLKALDLRESEELDTLIYTGPQLQNININDNEKLRFLKLEVWSDDFLELDISDNINLENVELRLNQVVSIDISRLIKLRDLDIINSPKLVCTKIFENQDISKFTYGYHTTFTTDCANLPERDYTFINNENLERLLIGQNIDTEDELDGKVLTKSLENAKFLYVGHRQSYNLENFVGLETLVNLEWIYFESLGDLKIEEYDFTQHPKLTYFGLDNYAPAIDRNFTLDLSQLAKIETLYLWSADINNLDFSECTELKDVTITELNPMDYDFTKNTQLESINIDDVNSLDVTQCLNLKELELRSSALQSIDLSNNTLLENFYLYNTTAIDNLDISENVKLELLTLFQTSIENIDLSNNNSITQLFLSRNELMTLDVTNLNDLLYLGVNYNNLTSLDISNNLLLKYIGVQNNPDLNCIKVSENQMITSANNELDSHQSFATNCN